jgi:hypothetical protein
VAGEGVERGSARLSPSTRCDVTWPNRSSDLRLGQHLLYHPGGIACILALAVEEGRCLRHCRRLHRAPARHNDKVNNMKSEMAHLVGDTNGMKSDMAHLTGKADLAAS